VLSGTDSGLCLRTEREKGRWEKKKRGKRVGQIKKKMGGWKPEKSAKPYLITTRQRELPSWGVSEKAEWGGGKRGGGGKKTVRRNIKVGKNGEEGGKKRQDLTGANGHEKKMGQRGGRRKKIEGCKKKKGNGRRRKVGKGVLTV